MPRFFQRMPRIRAWLRGMADMWWIPVCMPPIVTSLVIGDEVSVAIVLRQWGFSMVAGLCLMAAIVGLHAAFEDRARPLVGDGLGRYGMYALFIALGTALGIEATAVLTALPPLSIDVARARAVLWRAGPWVVLGVSLVGLLVDGLRSRAEVQALRLDVARREALLARLEALQARTDPHFLFNSLNTVVALIGEDPARAEDAVERLADLFRYALDAGRRERVPLQVELDAVDDYLTLQRLRFESRLDAAIEVDLPPAMLAEVSVPPLVVQPLVENAVVHGLTARPLRVRVRIGRRDADLRIAVEDDGRGFGASTADGAGRRRSAGTGLSTLRDRLALTYGARAAVIVDSTPGAGSRVTLTLPLDFAGAGPP